MPKWTPRQEQAITARNREILVSAAAGSGKTAVLIERVLGLLKEGQRLDRMLVVTFTHAAADEMKERLTEKLAGEAESNEHLRKQYFALGRADITTLHSFCMRILKRHFQAADTDPLSRMADEAQADELLKEALDEALDLMHEEPDEDALSLFERFTEDEIILMTLKLHDFLMSQEAPMEWLETMLDSLPQDTVYTHPWYRVMVREADLQLQGAEALSQSGIEQCQLPPWPVRYLPAMQDDLHMARILRQRLKDEARFTWTKPAFTKLAGGKISEEEKAPAEYVKKNYRDKAKDQISKALSLLPGSEEEAAEWAKRISDTRPQLSALVTLLKHTQRIYKDKKAAKALWDFNDLEHLALLALNNPKVQEELSSDYDALFVDEYQDISNIQEAIIRKLRNEKNTLFMVGDVKQSIYRFRLADPTLFLHKYNRFSTDVNAPSRLINLKENFRSNKNILDATNLVFEHAMQEDATELSYDEEASLSTLRKDEADPPVELWVLTRDASLPLADEEMDLQEDQPEIGEEEESAEEDAPRSKKDSGEIERSFLYEARLIAKRIKELVGQPIKDGDALREIQYRDIAILMRAVSSKAAPMAEALGAEDIPTYSDAGGEFYTQSDVRDALSLLQVIDNPLQDIPLLSALACPAFSFSPDELAKLRLHDKSREKALHENFMALALTDKRFGEAKAKLDEWRLMAQTMPLERFIARLLRDSGLYAVAGAKEDGALRRANLRILVSKAAPQPLHQSLADFVERALAMVKQKQTGQRSASLGMSENVVRIMTIHKSKGLQFPIVFMPDLAADFSGKKGGETLRLDAQTGLAITQINPKMRTKADGFGMLALKTKKNREELAEEARLLYVGMTRAKERLILIGAPKSPDSQLAGWDVPSSVYSAGNAKSMLDWVANPLSKHLKEKKDGLYTAENGSRWQIGWVPTESLPAKNEAAKKRMHPETPPKETEAGEDLFKPGDATPAYPQKSSVTSLINKALNKEQEEETPEVKRREYPAKELRPLSLAMSANELTGAQRGAAMHKALCALNPGDFTSLPEAEMRAALRLALDALLQKNRLFKQERDSLNENALVGFYQGDLAKRMAGSPEYHAEWPFTMEIERKLILQGVLDCCFMEDGQWVLVDYKTDRGGKDALLARYTDQMRWYVRALEDITGLPVKEAWLYLLSYGEAVKVERDEPITMSPGLPRVSG